MKIFKKWWWNSTGKYLPHIILDGIKNLFKLTGREATTILNKEIKEYFDEKLEEQKKKKNNIK